MAAACLLLLAPLPCATSACLGYTTLDPDPDAAAAEAADSAPASAVDATLPPDAALLDADAVPPDATVPPDAALLDADAVPDGALQDASPLLPDAPPPVVSNAFIGTTVSLVDSSSYEFNETSLGIPASNRTILVAVHAGTNNAASYESLTIDGVEAQKVVSVGENEGPGSPIAIFAVAQPEGSSARIKVRLTHTTLRCLIAVYAVYGLASLVPDDTASDVSINNAVDLSLDVQAGGLLLAAASRGGLGNAVASWNGVNERYEQIFNEGTLILTTGGFADGLPAGARTTKVIITKSTYTLRAAAVSFH